MVFKLPLDESSSLNELTSNNQFENSANQIMTASNSASIISNGEDEANGFVIVNDQVQTRKETPIANNLEDTSGSDEIQMKESIHSTVVENQSGNFQNAEPSLPNINSMTQNAQKAQVNLNLDQIYNDNSQHSISHNRSKISVVFIFIFLNILRKNFLKSFNTFYSKI